jgi:hypothetical protein
LCSGGGLVGSRHGIERVFDRYAGWAGRAGGLAAAFDWVIAQDLDRLGDAALADHARELRGLIDRLEGIWLQELAAVDARGAAGADQGEVAPSTADWLSARLGVDPGVANSWVRTARALSRDP